MKRILDTWNVKQTLLYQKMQRSGPNVQFNTFSNKLTLLYQEMLCSGPNVQFNTFSNIR